MGFEVNYFFHERLEEGYNTSEKKSMKKRVGDPFDDVPLDKLAGAILAQLARRDIWVTDVEIFELSKKKITFRESKGAVIIKNKKYMMDGNAALISQEIEEAPKHTFQPQMDEEPSLYPHEMQGMVPQPSPQRQRAVSGHPHNQGRLRPVKWVVFQPELPMMKEVKEKGIRFTPEKKYPVFVEQPHPTGIGMVYKTIDDLGREQNISDKYFVNAEINLLLDRELGFSDTPDKREGGKLLWQGVENEPNMPKLR